MFLSKPIQLTILSHALYLIIMKSYCHTTLRGGEKSSQSHISTKVSSSSSQTTERSFNNI